MTHTERASDEAAAMGVPPREVGKTLIPEWQERFRARGVLRPRSGSTCTRCVITSATRSYGSQRSRSSPDVYLGFELGAVPPLGGPASDRILVDFRIAELDHVIVEAGTHEQSIKMRTTDLLALSGANLVDICAD